MTLKNWISVAVIWAVSLVGVGAWAQNRAGQQPGGDNDRVTVVVSVISGQDIGFRVETSNGVNLIRPANPIRIPGPSTC
jgi:hypothetical protein